MGTLEHVPEVLSSKARSLESLGLQEVAWTKSDALELLAQLEGSAVAVMGGDVYSTVSHRLRPTYDNWSCERYPGERLWAYAERSQKVAAAFVRTYPDSSEFLFALVLSRDETAGL